MFRSIARFLFLLLVSVSLLSASEDCDCGLIRKDPGYQEAILALQTSIKHSGFLFLQQEPRPVPPPLYSHLGHALFRKEGSIFWKIEPIKVAYGSKFLELPFKIQRVVEWTDARDPIGTVGYLNHREEETFHFYKKNYAAVPKAFSSLRKDIELYYQRSIEFYQRRIDDFSAQYSSYRMAGGGLYYTRQEFQSSLESKRRDFKKALETLEKQQLQAIKALEHSLDLCLKVHNCPKAHLERGAFYFLEGRTLSALEHVYKAIRLKDDLQALREETLLLKSQVEAEAGLYVEAITTLTELVQKNPSHKEAYFERASAYFEVGDFDLALQDYLSSDFKSTSAEALAKDMTLFAAGLLTGAVKGGVEGAVEYIPSLLSSLHGLGSALWVFAEHPLQVSKELAEASFQCVEYLKEAKVNGVVEDVSDYMASELQTLLEDLEGLSMKERGEQTGFLLGKYGVEIFGGAKALEAVASLRKLKQANALLTFETAALNEENRLAILTKAKASSEARESILKSSKLTIEEGKQGKHLVGNNNYLSTENRSIFEHQDPQGLVNKYAGTGLRERGIAGEAGYQEVVDFGEFIGYAVEKGSGEKTATTWGKIHYSKQGTHVVPTKPRDFSSNQLGKKHD